MNLVINLDPNLNEMLYVPYLKIDYRERSIPESGIIQNPVVKTGFVS